MNKKLKQFLKCFGASADYFREYEPTYINGLIYDGVNTCLFTLIGLVAGVLIKGYV